MVMTDKGGPNDDLVERFGTTRRTICMISIDSRLVFCSNDIN